MIYEPVGPALDEIAAEYERARKRFGAFHNGHEAYAVILEEVDELEEAIAATDGPELAAARLAPMRTALGVVWANVKADHADHQAARLEAIQVAAMALAYIIEVSDE